jgi:twitching motility protein PilT
VVLIGEMRDLETIESALRIAETGHLTFGTLHTNSAAQTINRVVDVFPSHQQPQIRAQLSFVLEGILCQALLPKANGKGRAMAMEILVPNAAIRNLIREDKVHQIYSMMQTGQAKYGMQTFNQSLATLYFKKAITLQTALSRSSGDDLARGGSDHAAGAPGGRRRAPASGIVGGARLAALRPTRPRVRAGGFRTGGEWLTAAAECCELQRGRTGCRHSSGREPDGTGRRRPVCSSPTPRTPSSPR